MPKTTTINPVAGKYARALLELANDQNLAESTGEDLAAVKQLLESLPQFATLLRDPAISARQRRDLLERAFRGQATELLMNFLLVVNQHGRIADLGDLAEAYRQQLARQLGQVNVAVTVASELSGEQIDEVRERVGKALGKTPIISQEIDDSIIGGMVLRVEDSLIDASVRGQLNAMKRSLLSAAR